MYVYLVLLMPYSTSNIGVTLKSWLGVVKGQWKWRRSIYHIRLTISLPLYQLYLSPRSSYLTLGWIIS